MTNNGKNKKEALVKASSPSESPDTQYRSLFFSFTALTNVSAKIVRKKATRVSVSKVRVYRMRLG